MCDTWYRATQLEPGLKPSTTLERHIKFKLAANSIAAQISCLDKVSWLIDCISKLDSSVDYVKHLIANHGESELYFECHHIDVLVHLSY